ncbi:MAG: hypothetical protein CSA68_02355 [Rhodobacterales bacterium]|nr:MAG: hypothetical protein CSA68_02355 [Rhodobacterales bacterium]
MKKILLATSALVATAGVAAADVSVSGTARMGLVYNDAWADEVQFDNRVRIWFNASGETDGGLGWGAKVRIQRDDQGGGAVNNNAVWISGSWGKLTFGDVDSADKAIVGQIAGVGYTGLGDLNEVDYKADSTAPSAALYEYSAGDFKAALSAAQPSNADVYAVGLSYSTDTWSIAAGYGVDNASHEVTVKGSVMFGDTTVTALYQDDSALADAFVGVSLEHTFGATDVAVFYDDNHGTDRYGIGASYDLGGSATLAGGVAYNDVGTGNTVADLGIKFSF